MSKFLVIQIGQGYLKPMNLIFHADLKYIQEESSKNTFLYAIYEYNVKYDVWIPYLRIERGECSELTGNLVRGVLHA